MTPATTPMDPALMKPPDDAGVRVRMYRPRGIGDCFLLAFRASNDGAHYVLVDCGVFLGTDGGAERVAAIASDIEKATNGRLDVLVATHEHWDHLSGFGSAQEVFDRIKVGEVWLAWTEDPSDTLATRLGSKRREALGALYAAVENLQPHDEAQAMAISQVLGFAGDRNAALGVSKTADLIDYVRHRSPRHQYLRPGQDPITWAEVAGVRTFVLGPPRDEKLLSKSNPSRAPGQVYARMAGSKEAGYFYASALKPPGGTPGDLEGWRENLPFDESLSMEWQKASNSPHADFFRMHYGFGNDVGGEGRQWRRIDADWLGEAGQLALQLDNDTNNTSLVLAFELIPSGKVLLFPGDAQVGNWLSWANVSWRLGIGGQTIRVKAPDLVRRTVLYKVGHHGSHNATLRENGLELMESRELVALMPVEEAQAEHKRWAMPYPPLLERLLERTRGRVIRSDAGLPSKPVDVPQDDWDDFRSDISEDPGKDGLWIEYSVRG